MLSQKNLYYILGVLVIILLIKLLVPEYIEGFKEEKKAEENQNPKVYSRTE